MSGILLALAILPALAQEENGGAPSRREEVYDFTQELTVRPRDGGQYEIRFASKGRCDVTVGIVDRENRIIRHLVSGVLGPHAPEPLKKNSLEQTLLWDGLDDFGRKVASPSTCRARVSLGLKPVVDKVLLWHPNRFEGEILGMASDPDGVYIHAASRGDHCGNVRVAQFDHQGKYVRTLLPFPQDKMAAESRTFLSDRANEYALPKKVAFSFAEQYGFCVSNKQITMVRAPQSSAETSRVLFRMGTDGSMPVEGYLGKTAVKIVTPLSYTANTGVVPCWLAASPDGKWYYYSGTGYNFHAGPNPKFPDHAIYRIATTLTGNESAPFVGQKEAGSENGRFNVPMGMAVDNEGKIYVADSGNDRIQVFSPEGKHVRSIPVQEPWLVAVHPKTHAVYALSYPAEANQYKIIKFLAKPEPVAEQAFAVPVKPNTKTGTRVWPTFCLDPWATAPTVWITDSNSHIQLWEDKGGSFERKRDLFEDMLKDNPSLASLPDRTSLNRWQPIVDPSRPHLYLGTTKTITPYTANGANGPRIHTETGRLETSRVPWVVGYDGLGYALFDKALARGWMTWQANPIRFELETGKMVPFENPDAQKCKTVWRMMVSPQGEMAIQCLSYEGFTPATYPGRPAMLSKVDRAAYSAGLLTKFDRQGKLVCADLLPGLPITSAGISLDFKGNIYVGLPFHKVVNGKDLRDFAIAKFAPDGGKFIHSSTGKSAAPPSEKPSRPPDFRFDKIYKSEVWAEGMLWSYGATLTPEFETTCVCHQEWFSLDPYARSFVPEGSRSTVSVVDTNGNFILRMGGWGNCDAMGPELRLSYVRFVGVSDSGLYIDDQHNCRMLKVALKYEKEKEAPLAP